MAGAAGTRVYLIDDDAGVLESTAFLLSVLGYDCATFGGAEPFLEAAGSLFAACIVTDLRMPGMSGFELVQALRERGIGWPVILMTSEDGEQIERNASAAGFAAVLRKPVDADQLADAIAQSAASIER
jgi:FixJ family two-component response regulator